MSLDTVVVGPRTRTYRAGWGWLLLSTLSRAYLVFLGSLAACALLPMLAGWSGAVVQSGSMEPHISTGDVVLSQFLPPNAPPPVGRVITYRAPAGSAHSGNMLHRIVAVNVDGSLVTAGDANAEPDSAPLARPNIVSQARLLIPWVGLPAFWVTTGAFLPLGIWALLTVAALLIGFTDVGSQQPPARQRPANPQCPPQSGPGPESPDAVQAARPQGESISTLLKRVSIATGPAAVTLVALLTAGALAAAPLGQVDAAFSARTSSPGNTWGTAGPASKLVISSNPSGATGGIAFATQPVVTVQDAGGNTVGVSNAPVTLTITTPAGATLACTTNPKSSVAGVATFASCSIDKTGTYTLTASSGILTTAVTASFAITVGPATKLGFTASPSSSSGGTPFATQPVVTVQDAGGNTSTTSAAPVTLGITTPAGAVLTCTANPKAAVAGVATFAGCKIDKMGTYTLTAAAAGVTGAASSSFTITVGLASKLAFTTSPSGSTGGTTMATQPVVTVQDAGGNTVTTSSASITLSITTPAGATVTCTSNPLNAVAGVATFAGCKIDKIGTYTLTATSGALTTAASSNFTISLGAAAKLAFTTSPSNTPSNTALNTQPVVTVQDAGGNTVTTSVAPVTLAITPPAGGATLTNCTTNPKTAIAGVATFAGCRVSTAGTYTLTATATGLTGAVSASFPVSGPATKLAFSTSPSGATGGTAFGTQPVVTVQDVNGTTVTTSTASVTLTITTPAGATLSCTANPKNAVAGVDTFAGCRINTAGTDTLTAASGILTGAVSASFTIS